MKLVVVALALLTALPLYAAKHDVPEGDIPYAAQACVLIVFAGEETKGVFSCDGSETRRLKIPANRPYNEFLSVAIQNFQATGLKLKSRTDFAHNNSVELLFARN